MPYKFKNPKTGEITIHDSDAPRRDPKTQVKLELIEEEPKVQERPQETEPSEAPAVETSTVPEPELDPSEPTPSESSGISGGSFLRRR